MTLQKLTDELASQSGLSKAKAEVTIGQVTDAITAIVSRGEVVRLRGFGTFEMKDRAERKARNPQTGEPLTIAAHKALTFKAHRGK